jgi:hypothetical protein
MMTKAVVTRADDIIGTRTIDDVDGLLQQPWTRYLRNARSSPSDLLRPEFGVVPYLLRAGQIADVIAWCDRTTPMSIARISGGGGSGKTRFALELCKTLVERGWLAGFWRPDKEIAGFSLPRLVVVDYAEVQEMQLALETINDLQRSASEIAPVRVLLLTRTAVRTETDNSVRDEAPASLLAALDSNLDIAGVSDPLEPDERRQLYRAARNAFVAAWDRPEGNVSRDPVGVEQPDLSSDRYGAPLEVLFEALDSVLDDEQAVASHRRAPVERVLAHERRYWRRTAPHLDLGLQESAAALSTLAGADDDDQAQALLEMLPELRGASAEHERRRYVDWLATLYEGPGHLNPVHPDRLGESLVSRFLRGRGDGGRGILEALFALPYDAQVARCLDVLVRLVAADAVNHQTVKTALASRLEDLGRRTGSSRHRQDLPNSLAEALQRLAEALGIVQQREEIKQREVQAADRAARTRAEEEKTSRDYSDSVSRRDQLDEQTRSDHLPNTKFQLEDSDAAWERERRLITERVNQLEIDLNAARHARQRAEEELGRLRSEREDLDNLVSLKQDLENRLRLQIRQAQHAQREREEADRRRAEAEQRGEAARRQLEMQFERAQHAQREREEADRRRAEAEQRSEAARRQLEMQFERAQHEVEQREKAQRALETIQRELQQLEHDWDLESRNARSERVARKQAERDKATAEQQLEETLDQFFESERQRQQEHELSTTRYADLNRSRAFVIALASIIAVIIGAVAAGILAGIITLKP